MKTELTKSKTMVNNDTTRAALSSKLASSHMQLFKIKHKIEIQLFSHINHITSVQCVHIRLGVLTSTEI